MDIYLLSKSFPKEETYALTDQIRRSSRAVCANIAEAYGKRIYPKHFTSKMTDSDSERLETTVWMDYAKDCNYITKEQHIQLVTSYEEVGKLCWYYINNPEKFGLKKNSK